jgi:hypothetical protein
MKHGLKRIPRVSSPFPLTIFPDRECSRLSGKTSQGVFPGAEYLLDRNHADVQWKTNVILPIAGDNPREYTIVQERAPKGPQRERSSAPVALSRSSGDRSPFGFPDSTQPAHHHTKQWPPASDYPHNQKTVSESGRYGLIGGERVRLRGTALLSSLPLRRNTRYRPAVPGCILIYPL